ncbi:hypothetical protein [Leifsonia sp. NPDC058230]|uniref:hypothetical protein n=1 Tax=Leifsonia sp. NPDC058230 TaxID=3346391 RepID=UPI0036DC2E21
MHPLTLWLTSIAELGEKERERTLLRQQREARGEESPLQRDGRWAATMHRLADQSRRAAAAPTTATPTPSSAPSAAPATARTAALGCA